jgi:hypothetical protein
MGRKSFVTGSTHALKVKPSTQSTQLLGPCVEPVTKDLWRVLGAVGGKEALKKAGKEN